MNPLFGFFGLDPIHWVIIGVVGILLFGKRLPEVGRSLGKGIIEFKKGLKGLEDHYRVEDAYYGGQVGLRGEARYGGWFVNLRGEVGLGGNVAHVRAFGSSLYQTPAERLVTPTGLTVQASNTGTFDHTTLNMVSEAGLNVGYRVTDWLRIYAGYTFLLWDSPLRSGNQIDLVVNTRAGTAPARQAIPFKEDLFWAQGLNAGVEFAW